MSWVILFFAIVFEVAGTLTLKFTEGMTRLWPTVLMFAFYLVSLFGLSVAVSKIPVGTAYAVWSGVGTLMVAVLVVHLVLLAARPEWVALTPLGPTQNSRFWGIGNQLETLLLAPLLDRAPRGSPGGFLRASGHRFIHGVKASTRRRPALEEAPRPWTNWPSLLRRARRRR